MAVETWNTATLIEWVERNLSKKYHHCIPIIKEHDIDGKLLKECLGDQDAKSSLLGILFPESKDAFLRLSFMRKIEKIESHSDSVSPSHSDGHNKVNNHHQQHVDPSQSLQSQASPTSTSPKISDIDKVDVNGGLSQCPHCGAMISSFMIENHLRHCLKQKQLGKEEAEKISIQNGDENNGDNANGEEEVQDEDTMMAEMAVIEEHIEVQCEFCEIAFNISLIEEHSVYCGSRTDLCAQCGQRDTLKRFKYLQHQCYPTNHSNSSSPSSDGQSTGDISFRNTSLDIRDQAHSVWISSFERQLFDLQKLLHDRFVVDYTNTAVHFQQFDHFGNAQDSKYRKRSNQQISSIRTLNASNGSTKMSNESRSKYERSERGGKSKEELRREYDLKLKSILNVMLKIIGNIVENPGNGKYRVLKCNNHKLTTLLFNYSPCCEFLKLCDFEYVEGTAPSESCYRLKVGDAAKLKVAMGVIKYVQSAFERQEKREEFVQEQWESKVAYTADGAWSCKKCNHLNRKTSICRKCKYKKKHCPRKEKRKRMEVPLSVKRWICGECGNRNAEELEQCDNCKRSKVVADRTMMEQQKRRKMEIECRWKWKNDNGEYEGYEPDISNVLDAMRIGEVTVVMDQYSIQKISNEFAVQKRLSSGNERDVKRYVVCLCILRVAADHCVY